MMVMPTYRRGIDRRRFLLTSLVGVLAAPLAAEVQPGTKIARIGYPAAAMAANPHFPEAFRQGLRDLGYVEGRNILIEYRSAEGQLERLHDLAVELVRLKVDVLVREGTPPTLAAKQATKTIPIVFAGVADAVGAGLVTNFARPTANITGATSNSAELGGKRLELPKAIVPTASPFSIIEAWPDGHRDLVAAQDDRHGEARHG
jgi:putative ABC transport system substrate-binding protein